MVVKVSDLSEKQARAILAKREEFLKKGGSDREFNNALKRVIEFDTKSPVQRASGIATTPKTQTSEQPQRQPIDRGIAQPPQSTKAPQPIDRGVPSTPSPAPRATEPQAPITDIKRREIPEVAQQRLQRPEIQEQAKNLLRQIYDQRREQVGDEQARNEVELRARQVGIDARDIFKPTERVQVTVDNIDADGLLNVRPEEQIDLTQLSPDTVLETIQGQADSLGQMYQQQLAQSLNSLNELKQTTQETQGNIDQIAEDRIRNANETAERVRNETEKLRDSVNALLDERAANRIRQTSQRLLEQGLLTEQGAETGAAFYIEDLKEQAREAKLQMEQQIAEQNVNIQKERGALIDQIMQQQGIDENTKQQQAAQINSIYNNLLQANASALAEINTVYDQAFINQLLPLVQSNIQRFQEQQNVQAEQERVSQANVNPTARIEYFQNKTAQVDSNLVPFIVEEIRNLQSTGSLMDGDVQQIRPQILTNAKKKYENLLRGV